MHCLFSPGTGASVILGEVLTELFQWFRTVSKLALNNVGDNVFFIRRVGFRRVCGPGGLPDDNFGKRRFVLLYTCIYVCIYCVRLFVRSSRLSYSITHFSERRRDDSGQWKYPDIRQ